MKFKSLNEKRLFCIESGHNELVYSITESWEPPIDMVEEFIKKREDQIAHLADFRKSQNTKASWRRNRYNYMSGIKDFHKSTKGKQMHRKLGDFIATHDFKDSIFDDTDLSHISELTESLNEFCESKVDFNLLSSERTELLKAISSIRTHLFVESEYYRDHLREANFRILLNEARDFLRNAESSLLEYNTKIPVSTLEFICRIVEPEAVISKYSALTDTDKSKITNRFNSMKENLERVGITEECDGFYTILYNNLRKVTISKGRLISK